MGQFFNAMCIVTHEAPGVASPSSMFIESAGYVVRTSDIHQIAATLAANPVYTGVASPGLDIVTAKHGRQYDPRQIERDQGRKKNKQSDCNQNFH